MGGRGKGEREALFKGFPLSLPPAAGGPAAFNTIEGGGGIW